MSGKPKTIPCLSHSRKDVSDSEQIPVPYDQNRARQCAEHTNEAANRESSTLNTDAATQDVPTDENFVNDDIIEENSHVIQPVKKEPATKGGKRGQSAQ